MIKMIQLLLLLDLFNIMNTACWNGILWTFRTLFVSLGCIYVWFCNSHNFCPNILLVNYFSQVAYLSCYWIAFDQTKPQHHSKEPNFKTSYYSTWLAKFWWCMIDAKDPKKHHENKDNDGEAIIEQKIHNFCYLSDIPLIFFALHWYWDILISCI